MTQPRYVTDETGKRVAVLVDIEEYEKLLEELEDQDASRAADEARASGEKAIPWDEAKKEIAQERTELRRKGLLK